MPAAHRVASLLQRWLLGTHQGSASPQHLDAYLNEFTFRFNRTNARRRGLLFHRLLEQAVMTPPKTYSATINPERQIPFQLRLSGYWIPHWANGEWVGCGSCGGTAKWDQKAQRDRHPDQRMPNHDRVRLAVGRLRNDSRGRRYTRIGIARQRAQERPQRQSRVLFRPGCNATVSD